METATEATTAATTEAATAVETSATTAAAVATTHLNQIFAGIFRHGNAPGLASDSACARSCVAAVSATAAIATNPARRTMPRAAPEIDVIA